MHPDAVLNELVYACRESCQILHDTPLLNLEKNLTIQGDQINMNFQRIQASSINVNVTKGDIYINHAQIQDTSKLYTEYGDVVFQSSFDFILEWEQDSNYICLNAPDYKEISAPQSCSLDIHPSLTDLLPPEGNLEEVEEERHYNTKSCKGSYALCFNSTECEPSSLPRVSISALEGNIFCNIIDAPTFPTNTNWRSIKGKNYREDAFFDRLLNKSISKFGVSLNETGKSNNLLRIDLGNIQGRSTSAIRYIGSVNPAYLDASPWLISFFSLKLLTGTLYKISGRLVPGICPYTPVYDSNVLHLAAKAMKRRIGKNLQGRYHEVSSVYDDVFGVHSDSRSTGVRVKYSPNMFLYALDM